MRFGVHLPQYGRAAGPVSIRRAARQAEDLGLDHVWVSDHQVVPADQGYPSPYLYDPLTTLTWAGAVTERVELGTSVLVLPQYDAVQIANSLASLDALSGGRLVVGVGVGWSAQEFAALGKGFADRGRRADEMLVVLRRLWEDDEVTFTGDFHRLERIRLLPKPARRVPIWVGGHAEAAMRRAVELGDGFHALGLEPDDLAPVVERLRRDRPGDDFTISLRVGWDGLVHDADECAAKLARYRDLGVADVLAAPGQRDPDDWLRSVERLAAVFEAV